MQEYSFLTEKTDCDYRRDANEIMFRLMTLPEFTADDFYDFARAGCMPPDLMKKHSGAFFRSFSAAGYIEKNGEFKLSKRNGSTPLPVWVVSEMQAGIQ